MAFKDTPKSDQYSKNSEKSLYALKGVLLMENGFISRTVSPDFGVDENVELLFHDGKSFTGASGKHFAIQLKSVDTERPYIVKDGIDCIKLQFETSRLGYLLRNELPLGIVAVFDVKTSTLYFEYAEEIYNQLTDIHEGDCWKSQGKVTIYIKKENLLNAESAKHIHGKMLHMHQNAQMCFKAFGENYGIKTYDEEFISDRVDFNDPKVAIGYLDSVGWKFIQENEFSKLLFLIDKVDQKEFFKSSKLTAMVATIYCESGQFIESNFFVLKYNQLFDVNDQYFNSLKFIKYKTDFALGNIDYDGFQKMLLEIVDDISGEYNNIIIKINLLHISLLKQINEKRCDKGSLKDLMSIVSDLKGSSLSEKQMFHLSSYNVLNFIMYYVNYVTTSLNEIKIKENAHLPILESEVVSFVESEKLIDKLIRSTLCTIWMFGERSEDSFLKAISLRELSNFFFLKNYKALIFDLPNLLPFEESNVNFEDKINQAFTSSNLFEVLGRYKDSYNSLCLAYELTALYFYTKGVEFNNPLSDLESLVYEFSKQYNLNKYESLVVEYFNQKREGSIVNDDLILELADQIFKKLDLPEERKVNIVSKLRDNVKFFNCKSSTDFNLYEDLEHITSDSTHFLEPVTFFLECKKCKSQSLPNKNIDVIISYMNLHKCGL